MKYWALFLSFVLTPVAFSQFKDTDNYPWQESIAFLESQDIIAGYSDGTYRPEQTINRAEFTKIVMEAAFQYDDDDFGETCFTDVEADDWFSPYVCDAKVDNIIAGYSDGTFRPAQNINQAEALKILYETFYDPLEPTHGPWYQKYFEAAELDGMLYFNQSNAATHLLTRGEMAYFMAWVLDDYAEISDEIALLDFYGSEAEIPDFWDENLLPENCYEDEYYDETDQTCYLIEEDFTNDESLLDVIGGLLNWGDDHDHDFGDEDLGPTVTYAINQADLVLISQADSNNELLSDPAVHALVWDRFKALIPARARNNFVELVFFYNEDDSTAAYVEPQTEALEQWVMGVNLADMFFEDGALIDSDEFDATLIHEFAHVLTLNHLQVDPEISENNCSPRYFTGEGCARANAFINRFVQRFWKRNQLDRFQNGETAEAIYATNPTHFVTEYAATNPGEDIAESFTYFVVQPKPAQCENAVADSKLCFMYDYPQLVSLRNVIRAGLKD